MQIMNMTDYVSLHEKLPLHHAFAICQRCQRPYLTIPLITFDASQRPFLIWVKCDTPLTRIKSDQRFCQIWLARTSNVPLLTFDSSQRHDNFDASQSCVKADVKSAPTPLIRVSKIVVQLWLHLWCESKMVKANFSCSVLFWYLLGVKLTWGHAHKTRSW